MTLPLLSRYADILRYDRERGVVLALDWRAYPQEVEFVAYGEVEAIALAIEQAAVGTWAAGYLAGYGLALAARAWAGRPSDARRGAIIQAAERLRAARPGDYRLARIVEQGLARADAATLAGEDAEAAVVSLVQGEVRRADRVAERCGRIAAGLLDEGDHVLAYGFGGPALGWMLHVAFAEQQKPLVLAVAQPYSDDDNARLIAGLAREIEVPFTLLHESALERALAQATLTVFVAGAEQIALDGAVAGSPGTARYAEMAQRHGIPRYILGYDGPVPATRTAAELAAGHDVTPPELISAIITSRGIYRPEMIARYLGDDDAPLDVIPLSPGG